MSSLFSDKFKLETLNHVVHLMSILVDQQTSIGEAPLIKKFLRGGFNTRPQLPRYSSTWMSTLFSIIFVV